jgi:hypothetical protein
MSAELPGCDGRCPVTGIRVKFKDVCVGAGPADTGWLVRATDSLDACEANDLPSVPPGCFFGLAICGANTAAP